LAQEQARAADEQARAALAQLAQLGEQVQTLQGQLAEQRQRTAALEQELADERARWQSAAEAPAARGEALANATADLAAADQTLALGSPDVAGAITRAQQVAVEVARNAAETSSSQEAALATEAQRWLAYSEDALQRGDLAQARQAVDYALRATQRARSLAANATPGAPAGNAAPVPASGAATGMGYGGY